MIHALRNCPKAGDLITGGIGNRLLTKEYELCIDWLEDSIRLLDKKAFEDFISTLQNIWNNINNAILGGKEEDARVIQERARKLNDDFQIHNFSLRLILPRVPKDCKCEKKPWRGVAEVNVDASVKENRMGLGIILRDSDDFVLCGRVIFINKTANPEWAELDALLVGI